MNSKIAILYIVVIHVHCLKFVQAQPDFVYYSCGHSAGDATYIDNLDKVLSFMSSNVVTSGFYNYSFGQNPKTANAIALCEGDIDWGTCHSCVVNSTMKLKELCDNGTEAVGWYNNCMLRYSDKLIYQSVTYKPDYCSPNEVMNSWNIVQFNNTMSNFMTILRGGAARRSSKFASANLTYADNVAIHGQVQCTPDLSDHQCNECLQNVSGVALRCFLGKVGGRAATPSCNIKYETHSIDKGDTSSISPLNTSARESTKIAIACMSASLMGAVVLGFCCICYRRRKLRKARETLERYYQEVQLLDLTGEMLADEQDLPLFPLDVIRAATQQFSKDNKLGEGGFGPVYKGTLLGGKQIAVKRLSRNSSQGLREFKAEVNLIARLQHINLVKLLGCCMEGKEMLLVYDYMPNGSLEAILFNSSTKAQLDWKMRHRIIKGIARGLLYLHQDSRLKIIHRDLKSSNVLLDNEFKPKISDFGMARIFGSDQSEAYTNRVVGTFGYMAPEYITHGTISVKSDVFSFGVLLLEIISGKKMSRFHLSGHGQSLLSFAWKLWSSNHELQLMDAILEHTYVKNDLLRCIRIALLCVQEDPAYRPTMSSVVYMLENSTTMLPQPTEPAFFSGRNVLAASSVNEITFSDLTPR